MATRRRWAPQRCRHREAPPRLRIPLRLLAAWRLLSALGPLALVLLGVLTLVMAAPARAGDGNIRWLTLRLPEADLHFPAQHQALAQRVAATWLDAQQTLAPLFNARPRPRLQLTIDDYVDGANGYATPLPYDKLHLQAYPPEVLSDLADHGDWVRALTFHEYAHILHMGDVSGLPRLGNLLLGRQFLPNGVMPRLLLEGIATWVETRHTGAEVAVAGRGGRIGSAQFGALLRAATLDGTWPQSLAELTGRPLSWPRGNSWYLYGSMLVDHLVQRFGEERLRQFMGLYGRQLVPYGVQSLARQVWGASLQRLWRDALRQEQRAIEQQWQALTGESLPAAAAARGEVLARWQAHGDGVRLSKDGEWRGRIRPSRDGLGALVAHGPRDGLARIELFQASGKPDGPPALLHLCALDCDEPLQTPDGQWLIFTESRNLERLYLHRELVAVRLGRQGQAAVPLTSGLRGRSFSLDDSGQWLVGVVIRQAATGLVALPLQRALAAGLAGTPLAGDQVKELVAAAPLGTVLDSPVMGGGWLWWTEGRGGARVLRRAPVDSQTLAVGAATAVAGAAIAAGDPLAPAHTTAAIQVDWVGDLQWFEGPSGPRLGALVDVAGRRDAAWLDPQHPDQGWHLRSRTLTGLLSAAHLADRAVTVRHHGRGLDVWLGPPDPPRRLQPAGLLPAAEEPLSYAPPALDKALGYELSGYQPWSTLRPQAWYPLFLTTGDGQDWRYGGSWLGVQVLGRDAAEYAAFSALARIRSDGQDPLLQLDLSVLRWEPRWTVSAAYDHAFAYFRRGFWWYATPTSRLGLRLGGEWQVPHLRAAWTWQAGLRVVQSQLREQRYDQLVPQDPGGPVPVNPAVGPEWLGDVSGGWAQAESYPDSIRRERQHSLTIRTTAGAKPSTGVRRWILSAQTDHAWPLGRRQVISWSANGVVGLVPGQKDALYRIQGMMPVTAPILGLSGPTSGVVRGAPLETGIGGHALGWTTLAWHLPLADIGRTLDTLPLYAGRLRGSLFADAAWAGWEADRLDPGGLASIGAELTLDFEIGYGLGGVLQLGAGWAPGFGPGSWFTLGM